MKENTNQIYLPETESSADQRCCNCIHAETQDLVHGSVQCMFTPGSPIAHSSDHVCMQFQLNRNVIRK